jgi:hypothetical protein
MPDVGRSALRGVLAILRPLIHKPRAVSMLDYLGVDPATFDVAAFEDSLSPKLAHDLGLLRSALQGA